MFLDQYASLSNSLNQGGQGHEKTDREVPDVVRQNSLAQIYNVLCSNKEEIVERLGHFYGEGDVIFDELSELIKAGPISVLT